MEARSRRLQLDAVLASQPELGPAVPDGGHGWVVLAVAVAIRVSTSVSDLLYEKHPWPSS